MARRRVAGWVALLVLLAGGAGCRDSGPATDAPTPDTALRVEDVLGGPADGFEIADGSHEIGFPADHGPHPGFRSEWWYLTGNLTADGRDFGYQLTIFRTALQPSPVESTSAWATRQVYMGHLAVGDLTAGAFRAHERFARGALGLAGARTQPFRVWIEDWVMETEGDAAATGDTLEGLLPMRVRAAEEGVELDLLLDYDRPLVLQGDGGRSQKGSAPANASYYYSVTRLRTRGTVTLDGAQHAVEGLSWLDREWSSSALESGQVGWDWFSLQLSDGSDLMLYVLRRDDGSIDPNSSGIQVNADGGTRRLEADAFEIVPLASWRSPASGVEYPARWRLDVPALDLRLQVTPRQSDQELRLAFRYWEGAVAVQGTRGGEPLTGRGFVELTGY